jgi:hypothetical protein
MNTKICYPVVNTYKHDLYDVDPFTIVKYSKPLIICARQSQKSRLNAVYKGTTATIIGWWDLRDRYFYNILGCPVLDAFREHDAILILTPERVWEPVQAAYNSLIDWLSKIELC